jgi:PIN domain nuclease of toxin-antitoxin system
VKRILLDTECWLWWHLQPERLNARATSIFEDRRSSLALSAASSWEMAIKRALGKLDLPRPIERFVPELLAEDGIDAIPVEHAHALRVGRLPPHHHDPFDRLLIAQAQLDRFTILTADAQLLAYDVDVTWAAHGPPPQLRRLPRRRSS